ncbi:MAG TPA: DUF4307 domain-containing protein [Nocardioidaceae bacterium]|nr:DUF4307 domain-containing protein [Nocardioidaceae bacterium]
MNDLATADAEPGADQRYGTRHPLRRPLVIAGVVVLGGGALAWLVWVMLFHGRPMVQSELVSFSVAGEHSAKASLTVVRRGSEVPASCLLRAQAVDHSIVGELSFTVGPSEPATTTLTKSIRTEREATSVFVVGCVADGQTQRR